MLLEIIVIAATLGVAIALWPWIVHLLSQHVIPFARRVLGESVGNQLTEFVGWIDDRMCLARQQIVAGWRAFQQNIQGLDTTYAKTSPSSVRATTTLDVGVEKSFEEEVAWEDLPRDVRRKLSASQPANVNIREAVAKRARELAKKHGVELTLES